MRRLLPDIHLLLWWRSDDPRFGARARAAIADVNNVIFVSAATAWEISNKKALGRLEAPDDLDGVIDDEGFDKLPITFFHGERAGDLPPLHGDPIDRMLIAQAQALEIVTADDSIPLYGVKTLHALT